jgi:glycosyltransferase involved in cell wall biosynthesis
MKNKPKLSVCLITYNQENFIKDCIEGILNQKTNFEIEIVIGNDCSTDLTSNICEEYSRLYSNIKYNFRKDNIGMAKNWATTLLESSGEYIAICEGDDYWIDPYKLQKQVDFLENNLEYVLCFHKIKILNENGQLVEDNITYVPDNYETQISLATYGNYIHTPSVVFRNQIKDFPNEFFISPISDFFLFMMLSQYGKLKYLEDNMAIYRSGVGVWSVKDQFYKDINTMLCFSLLNSVFKENQLIAEIFLNRIKTFIIENKSRISFKDFEMFNSNFRVKEHVFNVLINVKKDIIQNNSIENLSVFELILTIFNRLKKKKSCN